MEKPLLSPRINGYYKDTEGRVLRVTQINPMDPLGRDILGKITCDGDRIRNYSCTLKDFPEIWIKEVL